MKRDLDSGGSGESALFSNPKVISFINGPLLKWGLTFGGGVVGPPPLTILVWSLLGLPSSPPVLTTLSHFWLTTKASPLISSVFV